MSSFVVYPAIDLRGGRVVRLAQGDPLRETSYGDEALAMARRWREAGADWLHVVNLDGAFGEADRANREAVVALLGIKDARIQIGGGIRTLEDLDYWLQMGADRLVLGTAAVESPAMVEQAVARFGAARVAVGIDARDGLVRVRGWRREVSVEPSTVAGEMARLGVETIIFTNIARDGIGSGVDVAGSQVVAEASGLNVIASGGVASLDDVRAVKAAGLGGVIVGRALYEGAIALEEALAC